MSKDGDVDLTDPLEVLEILKNAIQRRRDQDPEIAKTALKQVLSNYEAQNRIFMIAAANAELPRIIRLLSFLNVAEEELFTGKRLENMESRELLKLYTLAQSNLLSSTDVVKKVADMRLEIAKAGGEGVGGLFANESTNDLNALAGIPGMDAQQRDRVRKTVSGLLEAINKDDSVTPNKDDEEETDESASTTKSFTDDTEDQD